MTRTEASPAENRFSAAYKRLLINNLQIELEDKRRKYEDETARLEESLFFHCEEAWTMLPMEVRNMTVETFCVKYGGDLNNFLKSMNKGSGNGAKASQGVRGGRTALRDFEQIEPVHPPTFSHYLPQTPASSRQVSSDSRDSVSTVSSRRMTLRSYSKSSNEPPPTPLVTIPLRNTQEICEFDPTSYASIDEMREEMGDDKCDEALARIRDMHEQLSRLLGF
ncbi:uncharacterized protein SPPG_03367 [Spizellomyces punctatus DAOM BR117]|uniref:Borealin N-terminal domain-containing protein n=1 Tax=Spizellomyces punctatus (strain DAOM BR117) TaxID=645134 RepID=A0A0L0HKG0_SPIPD|nr:uncharacterized protein SPPG_03367 [Spizellomyces punctatus DAOM BR117]KND01567.1 hypothetical protein SPPG_03367 [Spizellomyces punctatus DAOM BR117]|eukprot:XP_016609606.1 hypothetical protein SPPG_03367 [Spizellomyces punctatus DAOM BR117]